MKCPACHKTLDPERHGDLVFDGSEGQVWCDRCHRYPEALLELLPFAELESWTQRICEAFGEADPVLRVYVPTTSFVMNAADQGGSCPLAFLERRCQAVLDSTG